MCCFPLPLLLRFGSRQARIPPVLQLGILPDVPAPRVGPDRIALAGLAHAS